MATSVVLYASTVIHGSFPLDDVHAIVHNPDVLGGDTSSSTSSSSSLWTNDFWGTPVASPYSHKSYRPLVILSYQLDHRLLLLLLGSRKGEEASMHYAWAFHLSNVLWYAAVVGCVVDGLLRPITIAARTSTAERRASGRQGRRRPSKDKQSTAGSSSSIVDPALVAGLWFACHPVHAEAVAGLVGRAEMLAALAVVLASWFYREHARTCGSSKLVSSVACLMAACLCKETAVVMPLVLMGGEMAPTIIPRLDARIRRGVVAVKGNNKDKATSSSSNIGRATIIRWTSMMAVILWYLGLRYVLFGAEGASIKTTPEDNYVPHLTPRSRLLTALYIMARYLQLLVFPIKLSCDYGLGVIDPVSAMVSTETLFTFVAAAAVALLAYVAIRNVCRSGDVTLLVATGWIFAPLIPASHMLDIGTVLGERLLFIPSVGAAMIICHLLANVVELQLRSKTLQQMQSAMLGVLIFYFARKTMLRVPDWNDVESLIVSDVSTYPEGIKLCEMAARMNNKNTSIALPTTLDGAISRAETYETNSAFKDGKWMSYTILATLHGIRGSIHLQTTKVGGSDPSASLAKARSSFQDMVEHDIYHNAPFLPYCDFGLTSIMMDDKEGGLRYFDICFERTKATGSEVPLDHMQNFATLLRELSGVATNDAGLSKLLLPSTMAAEQSERKMTRGAKARYVFNKLIGHPQLTSADKQKWKRQRDILEELMSRS